MRDHRPYSANLATLKGETVTAEDLQINWAICGDPQVGTALGAPDNSMKHCHVGTQGDSLTAHWAFSYRHSHLLVLVHAAAPSQKKKDHRPNGLSSSAGCSDTARDYALAANGESNTMRIIGQKGTTRKTHSCGPSCLRHGEPRITRGLGCVNRSLPPIGYTSVPAEGVMWGARSCVLLLLNLDSRCDPTDRGVAEP